jgi:hypothetical protein
MPKYRMILRLKGEILEKKNHQLPLSLRQKGNPNTFKNSKLENIRMLQKSSWFKRSKICKKILSR